jgi:hypothetical protein
MPPIPISSDSGGTLRTPACMSTTAPPSETGKKYHVAWSSVAKIDGKDVSGGAAWTKEKADALSGALSSGPAKVKGVSTDEKDYGKGDTVVAPSGPTSSAITAVK